MSQQMVDAAAFHALRYDPAVAGDPATTTAPAYDELERFTYARHRTVSPYTVVELFASHRTEGRDTAEGETRQRGARDYTAAAAAFDRWRRTGVLVRDRVPAFYVYEEHELRHGVPAVQRGVLAAVALERPRSGAAVLPHEAVQPERVDERLERLRAVPLDLSPVYGFYDQDVPALRELLARPPQRPPTIAMTDEVGIDHRVWAVDAPDDVAAIRRLLADVRVVIADGHHRYATALAYQQDRRASTWREGDAPWDRTLMYLVDASSAGPEVLSVHRLVRPLPAQCLSRLARDFELRPAPADAAGLQTALAAGDGRRLGLRLPGGEAYVLHARSDRDLQGALPPGRSATWRDLDAAVLEHAVLPRLGVHPGAVQYRPDIAQAIADVDAGGRAGLFVLRPVPIPTVAALALAGEPMPAKTTWFRPKPRTGLVMREVG